MSRHGCTFAGNRQESHLCVTRSQTERNPAPAAPWKRSRRRGPGWARRHTAAGRARSRGAGAGRSAPSRGRRRSGPLRFAPLRSSRSPRAGGRQPPLPPLNASLTGSERGSPREPRRRRRGGGRADPCRTGCSVGGMWLRAVRLHLRSRAAQPGSPSCPAWEGAEGHPCGQNRQAPCKHEVYTRGLNTAGPLKSEHEENFPGDVKHR